MLSHELFVTNPYMPPSEGFGTQYNFIISAIIYAEKANKQFIYTPFQHMAHNYDNDPNFLVKKEKLINLIDHYPINTDLEFQKSFFAVSSLWDYSNSEAIKKVKSLFFAGKQKEKYFQDDFTNIAIHIRKYNSQDTGEIIPDLNDSVYCQLFEHMRISLSFKPIRFHVYSQGQEETFNSIKSDDVFLHLNESVEDTFSAMSLADVLVTAPSCFSYSAGILSDGAVLYFPTPGRGTLSHWLAINLNALLAAIPSL